MSRQLPEPGLLATSQLYLAEAQLLANDSKEALANATQAQKFLEQSGVISLAWRAIAVAALASQKEGDRANASRLASQAMESLAALDRLWGATDAGSFKGRPDVASLIRRITELTAIKR